MKIILNTAIVMLLAICFTSCLKDDNYDNGLTGINVPDGNLISIGLFGSPARDVVRGVDFVDQNVEVVFASVKFLGPAAPEDITVVIDTTGSLAKIQAVNAAAIKLPDSLYTLPGGLSVVIKKGTDHTDIVIKTNAIKYDPSTTYGLAFKVVSVSPAKYKIADNGINFVTLIGAKNAYDGVYRFQTSPTTSFQPNKDTEVDMVTTSSSTCQMKPGLLGSYSNDVFYTVDPLTNVITVTCPSLGQINDPRSMYFPATRKMIVFWKRGSGTASFEETITYKEPR